jgi:hypothetical protein
LSDGLLAWRCFVLFGKRPWIKWILTALVSVDFGKWALTGGYVLLIDNETGVGALSNIALGTQLNMDYAYTQDQFTQFDDDQTHFVTDNDRFQTFVDIWAWLFFAINSMMTTSVIYKILYVGRMVSMYR